MVQGVVSPGDTRRGTGFRTAWLGLGVVLVALVGAPRVYAADGSPAPDGGAAQAQPSDAPGSQANAPQASSSQAADQPAVGESTKPNASDGPSTPNAPDGPSQAKRAQEHGCSARHRCLEHPGREPGRGGGERQ